MTKEIKIPQISEDADVATVADIYVSEGDEVKKGQDLIAVDSDKASVDIPNEEGPGTIKEIKVSEGDEVKVGDVILILEVADEEGGEAPDEEDDQADESREETAKKDQGKNSSKESEGADKDSSQDEKKSQEKEKDTAQKGQVEEEEKGEKPGASDDVPAAPLARKFARELGIDLQELKTNDPGQRITREDVMEHAKSMIQSRGGARPTQPVKGDGIEPISLPDFSQWGETERVPLSGIRAAVAKNTRLSWQNIPHVTQHDKADMTELQDFRQKLADKDRKPSMTALMTKICTEALKQFPRFNASLDLEERELILKKYYNIAIAVDTDDGLLMPVIKNTDQKSLAEINDELGELAQKARDRKLKQDEMKGGNFDIFQPRWNWRDFLYTRNFSAPGGHIGNVAICNQNRCAVEDEFLPAEVGALSLSYDHRVIDGADAARFLRWVCEVMEEPFHLLE
ncbi:MAG: 2-oxo acid dehydrogenase subunit E2 [Owenweeksia sp.]|nr:2-oxo acid dehydrogenase subunit E2 [Owenweeksia sp.]